MNKFIILFMSLCFLASIISLKKYIDSWNTKGDHDNYFEHLIWGWCSGMIATLSGTFIVFIICQFVYGLIAK